MASVNHTVIIRRFCPGGTPHYREESFVVPGEGRTTVLEALQYIYAHLDPTLAFDYCCRYARCGLCAVEVDGRPVLSCTAVLRKREVVTPLSNLPVVRDLVVDRTPLERLLREEGIYFDADTPPAAGPEAAAEKLPGDLHEAPGYKNEGTPPAAGELFPVVQVPEALEKLLGCLECLCCHARCPEVTAAGGDLHKFAGPYVFLKLAQLYLDPRDRGRDGRIEQARRLGIERCLGCRRCRCPQGIPLYREAILPLLGAAGDA